MTSQRREDIMSNQAPPNFSAIEQVVIFGDLSKLTPEQRTQYYNEVCKSVGLNPLTKPFDYISYQGKLTLYATKNCTEQLRQIHGVSITDLEEKLIDDVFFVKAKAKDKNGRTDESTGAIVIGHLKGEAKANSMMKCETKAKRRVTLSICGLGWVDESETDSIPGAEKVSVDFDTGEIKEKESPYITEEQLSKVEIALQTVPECLQDILKGCKIANIQQIPKERYDNLIKYLTKQIDLKKLKETAENLPKPEPLESLDF